MINSTEGPATGDTFDAGAGGILRQPRAVWATAGASVVAFMGIGLVDPILPSIAQGLDATAGQVSLLFTSYFLITAVAMLLTGFVSSRIGGRKTLLLGLALVVVFAGLAGTSGSVGELVGFRAGWGLGNALFVSTALAVIVGAAAGGGPPPTQTTPAPARHTPPPPRTSTPAASPSQRLPLITRHTSAGQSRSSEVGTDTSAGTS
ncbi:MFS transporter, partial [Streptomyces sp. NPDC127077]|uniref:MFS transporter n=1 Tax=Streptomyces sp. NPDC127077 TaxID=3347131 RepID=UPI003669E190